VVIRSAAELSGRHQVCIAGNCKASIEWLMILMLIIVAVLIVLIVLWKIKQAVCGCGTNKKCTALAQIVGQLQACNMDFQSNVGTSRAIWADPVLQALLRAQRLV
jgi:competence protein ComGC